MALSEAEDKARVRREKAREAIAMASQSRWDEAVKLNQAIISMFPEDVEALNRMGKAFTELGRYAESRKAFQKALELSPNNTIAKKNLEKLSLIKERSAPPKKREPLSPQLFIEEKGKSCTTSVRALGATEALAKVTGGDFVPLKVEGNRLVVENNHRQFIGQIEPKLALRLVRLMKGGNKYKAIVVSIRSQELVLILREVYQHPSQAGIISFPSRREAYPYLPEAEELEEEDEAGGQISSAGWEDVEDEAEKPEKPEKQPSKYVIERPVDTQEDEGEE